MNFNQALRLTLFLLIYTILFCGTIDIVLLFMVAHIGCDGSVQL